MIVSRVVPALSHLIGLSQNHPDRLRSESVEALLSQWITSRAHRILLTYPIIHTQKGRYHPESLEVSPRVPARLPGDQRHLPMPATAPLAIRGSLGLHDRSCLAG